VSGLAHNRNVKSALCSTPESKCFAEAATPLATSSIPRFCSGHTNDDNSFETQGVCLQNALISST
jgi:hypothetical protein